MFSTTTPARYWYWPNSDVTRPTVRGIDDPFTHHPRKVGRAPTPSLAHDSRPLFNGRRRGGLHACPVKVAWNMHCDMLMLMLSCCMLKGRVASGTRAGFGHAISTPPSIPPNHPPSPLSFPPGPKESGHGGRGIAFLPPRP